jgi:hypothetical protein
MIEWHESGNNSALENLARHLGGTRPSFCNVRCAKGEKPLHYFEYKLKVSRLLQVSTTPTFPPV